MAGFEALADLLVKAKKAEEEDLNKQQEPPAPKYKAGDWGVIAGLPSWHPDIDRDFRDYVEFEGFSSNGYKVVDGQSFCIRKLEAICLGKRHTAYGKYTGAYSYYANRPLAHVILSEVSKEDAKEYAAKHKYVLVQENQPKGIAGGEGFSSGGCGKDDGFMHLHQG